MFYRGLLTLFPRAFRDRFAADLVDLFRDKHRAAAGRGRIALAGFWISILRDVLVSAILIARYDWTFTVITLSTLVAYIAFTFAVTEWRLRYYRAAVFVPQPGPDSDAWEGLQGTDSFFPFRVDDRWLAFYGSAQAPPVP